MPVDVTPELIADVLVDSANASRHQAHFLTTDSEDYHATNSSHKTTDQEAQDPTGRSPRGSAPSREESGKTESAGDQR